MTLRIFAIKRFYQWAKSHQLTNVLLQRAISEVEQGGVEANLGGSLYKKRIATKGRGKSGSVRVLIIYFAGHRTFFLYGFEKSDRDNITQKEKIALQELGKFYLNLNDDDLLLRLEEGAMFEINRSKE